MATETEIETMIEELTDEIEERISETDGGNFLLDQHQCIEVLEGVQGWCRDRAAGIREEIGDD